MRYPNWLNRRAGMAIALSGLLLTASVPAVAQTMITPLGVTLQSISSNPTSARLGASRGWAFADANGLTYYTYADDETGISKCTDQCAESSPPARPMKGAVAGGDWSIIKRPDKSEQWAYRGKPVYNSVLDAEKGQTNGEDATGKWRPAIYQNATTQIVLPVGFKTHETSDVYGQTLANSTDKTLYTFEGKAARGKIRACENDGCVASQWRAVTAPALAAGKSMGDFSVITGEGGGLQWAYKGKALYTYAGDKLATDARGDGIDGYKAVVLARHFLPADVKIGSVTGHGSLFTDAQGQTLYFMNAYSYQNGGHNSRVGVRMVPAIARQLGTNVCNLKCLKTWLPLEAPPGAVPSGFWEIVTRSDGTRQWTYKDYPMYRYAGDTQPGEVKGHNQWDIRVNTSTRVNPEPIAATANATGLYWNYAFPN
jgi:predicted lipoprotein with Yx(FWY)xxD motif